MALGARPRVGKEFRTFSCTHFQETRNAGLGFARNIELMLCESIAFLCARSRWPDALPKIFLGQRSLTDRGFQQRTNGIDQGTAIGAQFNDAFLDHLFEQFFATRQELDEDLAAVFAAWGAFDVGVAFHAIDEFDGAVMAERKAIGKCADGGWLSWRKAAN